jgi:hypothetical protein
MEATPSGKYFSLLSPGCADGSGKSLEKQAFCSRNGFRIEL